MPEPALRLVAPFHADSGYSKLSRALLRACHLAGYRVQAVESDFTVRIRQFADGGQQRTRLPIRRARGNPLPACQADDLRRALNVRVAHETPTLFVQIPESLAHWNEYSSGPRIGYTMQESDRVCPLWERALEGVDLLLAPSEYVQDTFRGYVPSVPCRLLPGCVDDRLWSPESRESGYDRRNLPAFLFFAVFSTIPRKGWQLLMQAFAEEFAGEDVGLIVKPSRAAEVKELARWLGRVRVPQTRAGRTFDPRRPDVWIQVIDEPVTDGDLADLYRLCDCYALPSAEGFGLPFVEAAFCGRASVALDGGGARDVVDATAGYPVAVEMQPIIGQLPHIYTSEHRFPVARIGDLRSALRQAYDGERDPRRRKGETARERALRLFSPEAIASQIPPLIELAREQYKEKAQMWRKCDRPAWGVLVGDGYGDGLAVLGNVQEVCRQTGAPSLGILHYGKSEGLEAFLLDQPSVREVRRILPASREDFMRVANLAGAFYADRPERWLPELLADTGIDPDLVAMTQVHWPWGAWPVHRPQGVVIPAEAREWARAKATEIGAPFVVVQPYSTNSVELKDHWPYWRQAVQWFLGNVDAPLVFCGLTPMSELAHADANVIDLIGKTPSMQHVFALADEAAAVVTTCNALGLWTALGRTPSLVVANAAIADPHFFYYRWQDTLPNTMVRFQATFGEWMQRAKPFFPVAGIPLCAAKAQPVSETSKHRHLVQQYCTGRVLDIGSGGDPVVPWAEQLELPEAEYAEYNRDRAQLHGGVIHRGHAQKLPFDRDEFDCVHASHVLEDFADWGKLLTEWLRVLKPGGFLLVAVPDHKRFRAAVARGQGDNLSHKHEGRVGELTEYLRRVCDVIRDDFVSADSQEYSILFIGRKL